MCFSRRVHRGLQTRQRPPQHSPGSLLTIVAVFVNGFDHGYGHDHADPNHCRLDHDGFDNDLDHHDHFMTMIIL